MGGVGGDRVPGILFLTSFLPTLLHQLALRSPPPPPPPPSASPTWLFKAGWDCVNELLTAMFPMIRDLILTME